MRGHTNAIHQAGFSPDGKKIITASEDTTVKIWDVTTGKLLLDLEGYVEGVFSAAPATFSSDGKRIVTMSSDTTAKIWDAESGKLLLEKTSADETLLNLTPSLRSPDGKKTIIIIDKTVQIKGRCYRKAIAEMKGHADVIREARFSQNGKFILTSSLYTPTKTWDAGTGQLLADLSSLQDDSNEEGSIAAFSPIENKIVTPVPGSNTARIWDVVTGKQLAELKGHEEDVTAAQFSPDGKKIITASLDGTAKIWDAASGTLLQDFKRQ